MALAERKDAKDIIGIYFVKKWICLRRFPVETEDLQDIKWSYDNSSIIIVDSPAVCKLLIYNIFGELLNKIDIYQNKLGIKKFNISPNGHLYCLGLFDQTLRIYNNISYTCSAIFNHNKEIFNDKKVNYYKEDITYSDSMGHEIIALNNGSFIVVDNGTEVLYGEAYSIKNGEQRQICTDDKWIQL